MSDLFVVSSHFKEDVSWLDKSGFSYLVVSKGQEPAGVKNFVLVPNRGMEFGSYIWYLLNFWDSLPEKMAFVHGHMHSYHQQTPIDEAIKKCGNSDFFPLNGDLSSAIHRLSENHPWFGRNFPDMWNFLGLDHIRPAPHLVAIQPGTQTVVSRNLVKSLGKRFWGGVFRRIVEHESHRMLALVMEVAWPMIFGKNPEDNEWAIPGFMSFSQNCGVSVLIANPGLVWNSSMNHTVSFDPPGTRDEWISRCLLAFENYSKVH